MWHKLGKDDKDKMGKFKMPTFYLVNNTKENVFVGLSFVGLKVSTWLSNSSWRQQIKRILEKFWWS